jgi:hypothetical protein
MSEYHIYERLLQMEEIRNMPKPEQTQEQRDFIEKKHQELMVALRGYGSGLRPAPPRSAGARIANRGSRRSVNRLASTDGQGRSQTRD